jgi:hypothetical protein
MRTSGRTDEEVDRQTDRQTSTAKLLITFLNFMKLLLSLFNFYIKQNTIITIHITIKITKNKTKYHPENYAVTKDVL